MNTEDLIGISEAASLLNWSQPLLSYYINTGRAPAYEIVGGRKYFHLQDILNWRPEGRKPGRKSIKGENNGKKE